MRRCLRTFVVGVMALSAMALFGGDTARAEGKQEGPAISASSCNSHGNKVTTVGGKSIIVLCGGDYEIGETWFEYQNRIHVFVIRTDRQVSHIWETCADCNTYSDWTSLGGTAMGRVWYRTYDQGRALRIEVWGTSNGSWCRNYNAPGARGQWTGWWDC